MIPNIITRGTVVSPNEVMVSMGENMDSLKESMVSLKGNHGFPAVSLGETMVAL